MQDLYGNEVSTGSRAALDAYNEGVNLFLAAQTGADIALERAIAEDPSFALAHAALARHHQMYARPTEAVKSIISARELGAGYTVREQSHISIIGKLIEGNSQGAYSAIKEHIADYPRDMLTLQPCAGVFSLIAFSGRKSREAETFAFFDNLKNNFEADWWFDSVYAFALSEMGRLSDAEAFIDRSCATNPANANAAHYRGHFLYEAGEHKAGWHFVREWLKTYDPAGFMHCHISWHDALWALELGETDTAWAVIKSAVRPGATSGPPINVLTDMASFLFRVELAGIARNEMLWREISDYATIHFSTPGVSFADAHSALAHAMAGNDAGLQKLRETKAGFASDMVRALADVFTAFAAGDWQKVIDGLLPMMSNHERLGGSNAQRDLIEFTFIHALLKLGKTEEAVRAFRMRRPLLAKDGLPATLFGS
ncbi:tetratricopeptide repeat protein [Sneathiella litorea]|uniref:Tetratricopeptide repeat protein 38 n=1 Tax=Sneathiella litorea TaxID=2606216 RepID=A0A6L8W702_9PROT|nr:tetratricopeptide repeat protein [Sneathiella litorea]MZR30282.1 tetratricopeptide repeat protein [Sneathiella litorea]